MSSGNKQIDILSKSKKNVICSFPFKSYFKSFDTKNVVSLRIRIETIYWDQNRFHVTVKA